MKNPLGQSLIEAVVTLGIVILMVTGLVVVAATSLKNMQASKNRATAAQLGQESLEVARKARDTDWTTFIGYSGKYCVSEARVLTTTANITSCPLVSAKFKRTLDFTYTAATLTMNIVSTVSWRGTTDNTTAVFVTILTKWK